MNIKNCDQIYRIAGIFALISFGTLFTTACSAATQDTSSDKKTESSQTENNKPELQVADFAKIQTALRSLDNSLAKQSDHVKDVKKNNISASSPTTLTNKPVTKSMKMGMGMGKGKNMMSMGGKSCMGMMCKMMMKNSSMMGMSPEQNKPPTNKSTSDLTLPGSSGALHLYHLGEQAFFMNFKDALELTDGQYETLLKIHTEWESTQQNITQQRNALEAKLWELTAQGLPRYDSIKNTIGQIETLNSSLRLQFITSVGEAVSILTPFQIAKVNTLWMTEQKDEQ